MQNTEFRTGVIKPVECVKEAWEMIKSDYWILFAITILGAMLGGVSLYVLIGAMICGIYRAYFRKMDGFAVSIDDLWKGFEYLKPSALATVVVVVPAVIWIVVLISTIYVPIIVAAMMKTKINGDALFGIFAGVFGIDLVVAVVMVCFHTLMMFVFPLIVDRQLSSWQAIRISSRAVMKNLSGVTGLFVVNFVIALAGEMVFCVGIYLAIPIIFATNAVAFRKVFPRLDDQRFDPPPPSVYSEGLV